MQPAGTFRREQPIVASRPLENLETYLLTVIEDRRRGRLAALLRAVLRMFSALFGAVVIVAAGATFVPTMVLVVVAEPSVPLLVVSVTT